MIRTGFFVALLLAVAGTALADFRTVSRAYEASLERIGLPVSTNGTLTLRACEKCKVQSLRVNTATRYSINNESVDLNEFRRQSLQVRNRGTQAVIVQHDLGSDVVTSVSISL